MKSKDDEFIRQRLASEDPDEIQEAIVDIYDGILVEIERLIEEWCISYTEAEVTEVYESMLLDFLDHAPALAAAEHVLSRALSIAFFSIDRSCLRIDAHHTPSMPLGWVPSTPIAASTEGA